jgi:hypothetical protein
MNNSSQVTATPITSQLSNTKATGTLFTTTGVSRPMVEAIAAAYVSTNWSSMKTECINPI